MSDPLADAVLDMVAWFELVDDATLEPDLAVKALEELAHHLHRLEGANRAAFIEHARLRIRTERDPRYRRAFEEVVGDLLREEG